MPTYTTTADPVTGVFKIDLPAALVSGEKVKVTAQKNGQTRSLNLQAPSEPYLPPGSGGNGSGGENSGINLVPLTAALVQLMYEGWRVLWPGNGAEVFQKNGSEYIENTVIEAGVPHYVVNLVAIERSIIESANNNDVFLVIQNGYVESVTENLIYPTAGLNFTKKEILDNLGSEFFTSDGEKIYILLYFMIFIVDGNDEGGYPAYKVTFNNQSKDYLISKKLS